MNEIEYGWGEKHALILNDVLECLQKASIKYFILRNYEGLPEKNDSKDVDLIIQPGKYNEAADIMLAIFKKHHVPNYYVVKYERVRCWFGIDLKQNFAIHIDLIEGYLNKGFEIFSFDKLYENTIHYKTYRVLDTPYDIAMLLLYKVIGCKELKEKYRNKIENEYTKNKNEINQILGDVLGEKLGQQVSEALKSKNYDWIVKNATELSKQSKKIAYKKKPLYTTINIIKFITEKIYRIVICPKKYKKFIAVEAPDGTGKTTFIDGLCVLLGQIFVCDIEKMNVYHFRPTILPNLGAVGEKVGVMEQDKDFTNPHRNKPANPISSFVRMCYYWLDYVLGGIVCIRKDVQFDKFSIFDRYIYDFIVDPLRSRINLPKFIRILFAKLVPQPHIVFILTTEADIIYKRKQELTLEEIDRQLGEFKRLKQLGKQFIELDAGRIPNEIVAEAAEMIIDKYTKRI